MEKSDVFINREKILKKYKKQMKRVAYINDNIINQYENVIDMIKVMKEYANVIDEIEDTIEKSMYKHGL